MLLPHAHAHMPAGMSCSCMGTSPCQGYVLVDAVFCNATEWAAYCMQASMGRVKRVRQTGRSMIAHCRMQRGRVAVRQRAAALDAAEAARRFQQETLGQAGAEEAGGPNMGRFVEQLTGRVSPGSHQGFSIT